MILGSAVHGTAHDLPTAQMYARQIVVPAGGMHLAFLGALIDGQGSGSGSASIFPAVYSEAGNLLWYGSTALVIADGESASWRSLRLDVSGVALTEGDPWLALRVAGATNSARLYGVDPGTATAQTKAAAGGFPATLAGAASSTLEAALFADVFAAYTKPDVDDAHLARLPWDLSQRFLTTGILSPTRQAATAGWYGPSTDPEQGANAIVRSDGPLAEFVGERLRVTYRLGTLERACSVYVHDEDDFGPAAADEDLSLSKGAFMRLAPLATDALAVEVAAMS